MVGFEHEADARPFWEAMRERLQEFALSLHPDKTRLLEFGRFAVANRKRRGLGKPKTFTFLGFTFICGRTRRGDFQIHRKTRRDRMQAKLTEIKEELRRRMHQSIPQQGRWLRQVVTGYYNYHAVPTNSRALEAFHYHVIDLWRRTLRRRSQKDGSTWERIAKIANDWLPKPRILHPWPQQRFAVRHPRWEPSARMGHVHPCDNLAKLPFEPMRALPRESLRFPCCDRRVGPPLERELSSRDEPSPGGGADGGSQMEAR